MIIAWLVAVGVVVFVAYRVGRHDGIADANRSAIRPGAWVSVVEPVSYQAGPDKTASVLPVGTQAVVTGIDKWHRVHLWIASPWARSYGWTIPQVFAIKQFTRLRALPISSVPTEIREETLRSLQDWQATTTEVSDRLFPRGFLELQRRLNQH